MSGHGLGGDGQRVGSAGGFGGAAGGDGDDALMADADPPPAAAASASSGGGAANNAAHASALGHSAASHATDPPGEDLAESSSGETTGGDNNNNEANNNDDGAGEAAAAAEKRRAIRAIMADKSLTDLERRLQIQRLMDGGRSGAMGMGGGAASLSAGGAALRTLPAAPASLGAAGTGTTAASSPAAAHAAAQAVACVHYERRCHVVAPCCGRMFGCRVCHDEMSPACGPMDRFGVAEVVCKECGTRQGSKTNACSGCGVAFAEYHCPKCNMWMALTKRPFHCDQCGFCRVGGQDNFRHCATCCMCVAASVYESHSCMADKYKNNCPVCREDMFVSRQSPQDLPCGHAIHAHCFRNLAGFDYRCPICKKTVVSRASMSAAWAARARDIELQPMPPDLAREVDIACNDCEAKSEGRGWHFLGVQCPQCSSFNTVVESMGPGNEGVGGGGVGGAGGSRGDGSDGDAMMEP